MKDSVLKGQVPIRSTHKQQHRNTKLLQWRKIVAEHREVDPNVIIPKDIIYKLSIENPSTMDELHNCPGFGKWWIQQYGEEIIASLKKADRDFSCYLCGREISEKELNVSCPFCKVRFHFKDISEHLSNNPKCPNCDEILDESF